ncbi:MAG: hypothetical protein CMH83_22135 [Nocardioides sp.]|nr:hypothetical protein [Nocardioides sp.]
MDLTSCPECDAPAEVLDRAVLPSTDGPVEHARVRCVARHVFTLPVERLARPGAAVAAPSAGDRHAVNGPSATHG